MRQTEHADEKGSRRVTPTFWQCVCACISKPVCVHAWVCVFVHEYTCDELTVASSIAIPLYNMAYISNRNNPFNLVHLSRSLMSHCTKKGQGGLGPGGWVEQTTWICAPFLSFSFLLSFSQWGFKVCFGVQLQFVYSLSKRTQTSKFPNRVMCVCAPCFGAEKKMNDGFFL